MNFLGLFAVFRGIGFASVQSKVLVKQAEAASAFQ